MRQPATSRAVSQLVHLFYTRLWNAWDDSVAEAVLDPAFTFRGSLGMDTIGIAGWRSYRDRIRTAAPDFFNQIVSIIAEDQQAAVRLRCSGTHAGELLGIKPTQQHFVYDCAAFFRAEGPRLADAWVIGDLDGLRRQLER